jgi:Peptidase M60, enhancin and enhancin-like/N-terminal domain of M60-like peptidases
MYFLKENVAVIVLFSTFTASAAHAQCAFEISGQPEASAEVDGLLFKRAARSLTGTALISGIKTSRPAADITAEVKMNTQRWDINGSGGNFDIYDASIIKRYLAGYRGGGLIPTGPGAGATRTTGQEIEDYIANGCPIPGQPVTLADAQIDPPTRTTIVSVLPDSQDYADQRFSTFRWTDYRSTGTYAKPNEQIKIAVGNVPAGTTIEALVGTWQQGSGVGTWTNAPTPLALAANTTTTVSTPTGGPVYVRATNPVKGGSVRFQIVAGGTPMPLFLLGRDSHAQFIAALNAVNVTPYVEMVTHRAIVTFKTDKVKAALAADPATNVAKIAGLFDKLLASHDSVAGLDNSSAADMQDEHPLHYTSHDDPTYYFFAYYNRTAYQQNFANVLFTKAFLSEEPGWGVWHESGHMYQGAWEWADLIEVSVNLYALEFSGKIGVPNRLTKDDSSVAEVKYWERALQRRSEITEFEELELFERLVMFWQLRLAYGPSFYGDLQKRYRNPATRPALPDDASRRQQFIVTASRIAKQDLRSYFNGWGLKATAATNAEVSALGLPAANVNALLAFRPL